MTKRVQKEKPAPQERKAEAAPQPTVDEDAQALAEEAKDWLDEIDAVLEENAEEFVKGYIQKGGQ